MTSEVDNQRGIITALLIIACCIVLALFGCSQQPVGPTSISSDPQTGLFGGDNGADEPTIDTVLVDSASISVDVGSCGKTLQLSLGRRVVVFKIPKDALTDSVTITITGYKYQIADQEMFVYDCGPDGLQFAEPILLTQPVPMVDGQPLVLLYYDERVDDGDGIGWEVEEAGVSANGRGIFHIHHFSKYGISCKPDPVTNEEGDGGCSEQ